MEKPGATVNAFQIGDIVLVNKRPPDGGQDDSRLARDIGTHIHSGTVALVVDVVVDVAPSAPGATASGRVLGIITAIGREYRVTDAQAAQYLTWTRRSAAPRVANYRYTDFATLDRDYRNGLFDRELGIVHAYDPPPGGWL